MKEEKTKEGTCPPLRLKIKTPPHDLHLIFHFAHEKMPDKGRFFFYDYIWHFTTQTETKKEEKRKHNGPERNRKKLEARPVVRW